jgi:hypothetical protein
MRMNFGKLIEIEDLGKHPAATVVNLGILLAGTVNATPDPKRKHFYEIEGGAFCSGFGSIVYYVYVSPFSHKIFLVASWKNILPPMPQLGAEGNWNLSALANRR